MEKKVRLPAEINHEYGMVAASLGDLIFHIFMKLKTMEALNKEMTESQKHIQEKGVSGEADSD